MKIILSGGERSNYRSILTQNGVKNIAINLSELKIPKKQEFILEEKYGDAALTVYTSLTDTDVERYDEFIRTHEAGLSTIVGRADYNGEWLGAKYYPLWDDVQDTERLASLMERFGRVAIPDRAITPKSLGRIRQLQQRWGASLLGLTSKSTNIEALPWDAVIVTSWTSVIRYHEVQVWDGHGLRRYPAQKKVDARKQHRADIVRLGVDYDEIMEDNVDESAKLSVLSWLEYEHRTFGSAPTSAYDPTDDEDEIDPEASFGGVIATISSDLAKSSKSDSGGYDVAISAPTTRHEDDKELLPVMGIEMMIHRGGEPGSGPDNDEEITHEPMPVLRTSGANLRQCDSCYLSSRCPKFQSNASCAYELPIELKTRDQLQAVIRAILEMQTGRVMFASLAEQLEGQGPDPTLSKEMDRLFNLIAAAKDIQDSRDLVKFTVEARTSGPSVMEKFFGAQAAEVSKQIATPMTTRELDAMLSPIIDADIVSDLEHVARS